MEQLNGLFLFYAFLCLVAFVFLGIMVFTKNNKNPKHTWDVVIVGAGISSAESARLLRKHNPKLSVLVLEQDPEIGGCLVSVKETGGDSQDKNSRLRRSIELGGMRYFPDIMPFTRDAVKRNKLEEIVVPISTKNTYNEFNGVSLPVHMWGSDFTKSHKNVQNAIKNRLYKQLNVHKETNLNKVFTWKLRQKVFNNFMLSSMNTSATIVPSEISSHDMNVFDQTNGYKGLVYGDTAAAIIYYELLDLSLLKQSCVRGGFLSLVYALFRESDSNSLKNTHSPIPLASSGVHVRCNSKVQSLNKTEQDNIYLEIKGHHKGIVSRKVLITTAPKYAASLLSPHAPVSIQKELKEGFTDFSATKIYMRFQTPWWPPKRAGRNLSQTPLQQVWVWDDKTLMIYSSGIHARYWWAALGVFPQNHGGKYIVLNSPFSLDSVFGKVYHDRIVPFLIDMFTEDKHAQTALKQGISPEEFGVSIWENRIPLWKAVPHQTILERRSMLRQPCSVKLPRVGYISNATSLRQGWVDGSLEEANRGLEELSWIPFKK